MCPYKKLFFASIVSMGILSLSMMHSALSNDEFRLLSDKQNGIVFMKDPCAKNAFSLIFSFSQDIEEFPSSEMAMVSFTKSYQDVLATYNEGLRYCYLEAAKAEKIGNRQVKITYLAKKVSEDGEDPSLTIPDQMEVVVVAEDLAKIKDLEGRSAEPLNGAESIRTLINVNTESTCSK